MMKKTALLSIILVGFALTAAPALAQQGELTPANVSDDIVEVVDPAGNQVIQTDTDSSITPISAALTSDDLMVSSGSAAASTALLSQIDDLNTQLTALTKENTNLKKQIGDLQTVTPPWYQEPTFLLALGVGAGIFLLLTIILTIQNGSLRKKIAINNYNAPSSPSTSTPPTPIVPGPTFENKPSLESKPLEPPMPTTPDLSSLSQPLTPASDLPSKNIDVSITSAPPSAPAPLPPTHATLEPTLSTSEPTPPVVNPPTLPPLCENNVVTPAAPPLNPPPTPAFGAAPNLNPPQA